MEIFYSKSFKKDFLNLPDSIRKLAAKKLELFGDNYRHPSLKTKKSVFCAESALMIF